LAIVEETLGMGGAKSSWVKVVNVNEANLMKKVYLFAGLLLISSFAVVAQSIDKSQYKEKFFLNEKGDTKMNEIIQHTVNYTLDELIEMVKPSTYEPVNLVDGVPVHLIKDIKPLSGEVFRKYPSNEIIEVSNLGRIKINNEIIEQWEDGPNGKGWLYIKGVRTVNNSAYVYRLVAETWCEKPNDTKGWQVHHISNNGYDNRPDNLIWIKDEIHKKIPTKQIVR
jgi:hypothetical protein